jgi:nitric oxide dioxygenase
MNRLNGSRKKGERMAINTELIKAHGAAIKGLGTQVTAYFYDYMFSHFPEVRKMFPEKMTTQQERLFNSLVYIATNIDNPAALVPYLERLGEGHIKYDTRPEQYDAVGVSLMKTLEHFLGNAWTPEVSATWSEAYNLAAKVMTEAAAKAMAPSRYKPLAENGVPSR